MTEPSSANPGRRFWDAIDELMAAAVRERSALAAALRLRPVDLDALRLIASEPGMSPTAVSLGLRMSAGGTAAVVDRLVAADLVVRERHPDGRRRVQLMPTPGGRAAVDAHREPLVTRLAELTDGVGVERVVDCLAEAATALDRQTARHMASIPATDAPPEDLMPRAMWG